jgi:hypothetical protein
MMAAAALDAAAGGSDVLRAATGENPMQRLDAVGRGAAGPA